jgi:hypothetical protein
LPPIVVVLPLKKNLNVGHDVESLRLLSLHNDAAAALSFGKPDRERHSPRRERQQRRRIGIPPLVVHIVLK